MFDYLKSLNPETVLYVVFGIVMVASMVMDLGLFNRKAHRITFRAASIQTLIWVTVAILFGLTVYKYVGPTQSFQFYTAYVTEYALSVDNIFVFILVFRFFKVDEKFHHKVLFYGVLGAIFFRALFIFATSAIIDQFEFILYIFGAFLLYTGAKMLLSKGDEDFEPEDSGLYRFLSKRFRFAPDDGLGSLTRRIDGKRYFTTLFMVILLIEGSDIIFAVDSIPAVFSITKDQFVIYTSNIFAIMGLRSLYFLLEGLVGKFHLLEKGVSFVLMFIGVKMMLHMFENFGWFHIEISDLVSLSVILGILAGSIVLSMMVPEKKETPEEKTQHETEEKEADEAAAELELAEELHTDEDDAPTSIE